jgi:hypothetical protein
MLIDLTGEKFNKLTVLELSRIIPKRSYWKCLCECGNEKIVRADSLKDGSIKSCGCLKKEQDKINLDTRTHNQTRTKLYKAWCNMKRRCYDKNNIGYNNYGGRGIQICNEWKNSFISFKEWAYSNGYKDDLTIDRIDVNGNYTPNNCKWSTFIEQCNNRRSNILIEDGEEKLTLKQLCDKYSLKYDRTKHRYYYGDRTVERLTRPVELKFNKKKTPR